MWLQLVIGGLSCGAIGAFVCNSGKGFFIGCGVGLIVGWIISVEERLRSLL